MDENIASILEGKYTPFISTCFVFRCRGCKYGQVLSCSSSHQELITHKRVVYMVISIWVYITFVSSMTLWGLRGTPNAFSSVTVAIAGLDT